MEDIVVDDVAYAFGTKSGSWIGACPNRSCPFCYRPPGFARSAFSPDGEVLAVACDDHCIHLVDTATFEEVAILRGHPQTTSNAVLTGSGRVLVPGLASNRTGENPPSGMNGGGGGNVGRI